MSKKLPPELEAKLRLYQELLVKWQKAVNLVAPASLEDSWNRHFQDSLQLLDLIPESARTLIDLGSGAGFPGLVLAIARPDLHVHLVEADQKKGAFLLNVSRETGAKNVSLHSQRIESVLPTLHGDVITARALASLSGLLTLSRSQWDCPSGGREAPAVLVFPKGAGWQEEVVEARKTYDFTPLVTPSRTSKQAAVLCITGVSLRHGA